MLEVKLFLLKNEISDYGRIRMRKREVFRQVAPDRLIRFKMRKAG